MKRRTFVASVLLQVLAVAVAGIAVMLLTDPFMSYGCHDAPRTVGEWFTRECMPGQHRQMFIGGGLLLIAAFLFGGGRLLGNSDSMDEGAE